MIRCFLYINDIYIYIYVYINSNNICTNGAQVVQYIYLCSMYVLQTFFISGTCIAPGDNICECFFFVKKKYTLLTTYTYIHIYIYYTFLIFSG